MGLFTTRQGLFCPKMAEFVRGTRLALGYPGDQRERVGDVACKDIEPGLVHV